MQHANLTKFCRIINIDVKNEVQLDILKIAYLTEQSVKYWSIVYKMQIRSKLCDVKLSKCRHWDTEKFFWEVELKRALLRGQNLQKSCMHCINIGSIGKASCVS